MTAAAGAADRGLRWFLAHLARWLAPYRRLTLLAAAALLVDVVYESAFPLALKLLIDRAIVPRDAAMLAGISAALVVLGLSAAAAAIFRDWLYARLSTAVIGDLRRAMYAHLQRLPMGYFRRTRAGDILACFSTDLAAVENAIVLALPMGLSSAASVILSALILFLLEWRMALLASVGLALCLLGSRLLAPAAQRAGDELKTRQADLTAHVQESVQAQPLVKAFGLHKLLLLRFESGLSLLAQTAIRANFLAYLLERIPHVGILLFNLLVLLLGAWFAFRGWIEIGTLVAFQGLIINLSGSLWGITLVIPQFVQAIAGMRRIDSLFSEAPEVVDAPDAGLLPRLAGAIEFRNVSFHYDAARGPENGENCSGVQALSFTIPAGGNVVFVGASGSGKSTVLALLMRLHDPVTGTVCFDGADLRGVTQDSLRAQLGVVLQEDFLFNASVSDNLRLVKPDASDAEIASACRAADIDATIAQLPGGYDSLLGERGGLLSGGQRQRLAIARALLRDPALLLLDEATSALDAASEEAVSATLARVGSGRTVVAVTHRLTRAMHADIIFVMHRGTLAETGTHEQLLSRRGCYFDLWEKQTGISIAAGGDWAAIDPARLARLPVFEDLDPALLDVLAEAFVTEQFAADRYVIHEGDEGDRFYVIARGRVEVTRAVGAQGEQERIAVLTDGDHFGEMALLSKAPRNASVRTLTATTLIALPRGQFTELVGHSPAVRARLEASVRARSAPAAAQNASGLHLGDSHETSGRAP